MEPERISLCDDFFRALKTWTMLDFGTIRGLFGMCALYHVLQSAPRQHIQESTHIPGCLLLQPPDKHIMRRTTRDSARRSLTHSLQGKNIVALLRSAPITYSNSSLRPNRARMVGSGRTSRLWGTPFLPSVPGMARISGNWAWWKCRSPHSSSFKSGRDCYCARVVGSPWQLAGRKADDPFT